MVKLYENIKSRRVELHMTQSELAAKVGYADKGMISRVENGKINLSQGQLLKIAQALETTPSALINAAWLLHYRNSKRNLNYILTTLFYRVCSSYVFKV